jgi:hypothetical protein
MLEALKLILEYFQRAAGDVTTSDEDIHVPLAHEDQITICFAQLQHMKILWKEKKSRL